MRECRFLVMKTDNVTEAWTARGLARKTISTYLVALRKAERSIDLDECSAEELRSYAESLPRTRWSRALLRSSLLAYWGATGRPDGPAGAIPVPSKPAMACRALEDADAAALAAAASRRGDLKGLAVLLGLYTGLRRSEIAALRWSDVDATGWVTVVGKGEVTRTFPLHDELRGAFDVAASVRRPSRRGHDWIFRGRWGEPVHPTTIWLWVREVADDAGLGAVPTHVLRHTALGHRARQLPGPPGRPDARRPRPARDDRRLHAGHTPAPRRRGQFHFLRQRNGLSDDGAPTASLELVSLGFASLLRRRSNRRAPRAPAVPLPLPRATPAPSADTHPRRESQWRRIVRLSPLNRNA